MRLNMGYECCQCKEDLRLKEEEVRGICCECWKSSSEDKADVVAKNLTDEVEGFSTLLKTLLETSPQMRIARIKDVRQHTGLNLKHAKRVVDKVNDIVPFLADPEVVQELQKLKATVSANRWAQDSQDRLEEDLVNIRVNLQREAAEATRLRLSNQNLEARLGASNRESQEAFAELNTLRTQLNAAEKLSEALFIVAKDPVVREIVSALTTLLDALDSDSDSDSDF